MKKAIFLSLVSCFYTSLSWGIVSTGTAWEIRSNATAGNLNGGCYTSDFPNGTDYSQQPAAQIVFTDLTIGAQTNQATSALTPFQANRDEGNCVHVTAGAGCIITGAGSFNQVVSVDGSGVATLMSTLGTAASVCTARLGGALSLNSTLDDDFSEALSPGNTVYVRSPGTGNYSIGEAVNIATDIVTGQLPIWFKGYNKVRGDLEFSQDLSTNPTINVAAAGWSSGGNGISYKNLNFIGTAATVFGVGLAYAGNVRAYNNSDTAARIAMAANTGSKVVNSDVSSLNGTAVSITGVGTVLLRNYIHHSSYGAVQSGNGTAEIAYLQNLFAFNVSTNLIMASVAANAGNQNLVVGNTFYGSSAPHNAAIHNAGNGLGQSNFIADNIFVRFSTAILYQNAYYNNFNIRNNYFDVHTIGSSTTFHTDESTFSDPIFIDTTTFNFSLAANSPMRRAIKQIYGASPSSGTMDMGGVQSPKYIPTKAFAR